MYYFYIYETGESFTFKTAHMARVMRRVINKFGYSYVEVSP